MICTRNAKQKPYRKNKSQTEHRELGHKSFFYIQTEINAINQHSHNANRVTQDEMRVKQDEMRVKQDEIRFTSARKTMYNVGRTKDRQTSTADSGSQGPKRNTAQLKVEK